MPVTDRREPAVYVSIEDASYVAPPTELGRVGYIATVCDRGPHNRVVTLTSRQQLHQLFGQPNFHKTSQAHYLADKFLQYSNKLLLVRVMPEDSTLANSYIARSLSLDPGGVVKKLDGSEATFTFVSRRDASADEWQAKTLYTAPGSFVYGTNTDGSNINGLKFTCKTTGYSGETQPIWNTTIGKDTNDGTVVWTCAENTSFNTLATDADSYAVIEVGTWIVQDGDQSTTDSLVGFTYAAQIVAKTNVGSYKIILDRDYIGNSTALPTYDGTAWIVSPYVNSHEDDVHSIADIDPLVAPFTNAVYAFYAKGAGSYYNGLIVKGVRNFEMEKMYTNADGTVQYPYLFMDIGVYYVDEENNESLLEGPWTVSLTRRLANNTIIRDLTSGNTMYIEDVLNDNSNYVGVVSCSGVDNLMSTTLPAKASDNRLKVMLILTAGGFYINYNNSVSNGGAYFGSGENGTVDEHGTVPMYSATTGELASIADSPILMGLLQQAYTGALVSTDGSVEQIPECVYPC
jgi:hypothetical protein